MKLNDFLEGVEILRKHYTDADGYHLGAEHDIIYLYATDTPLSTEEVKRMNELNWHQPEACNEDGEWTPSEYTADEGWAAFT